MANNKEGNLDPAIMDPATIESQTQNDNIEHTYIQESYAQRGRVDGVRALACAATEKGWQASALYAADTWKEKSQQ